MTWSTRVAAVLRYRRGRCIVDANQVLSAAARCSEWQTPRPCASTGFDGFYSNKAGKTAEGSATFWRRSRFTAAAKQTIDFRALFAAVAADPKGAGSRHAHLLPLLHTSPDLEHVRSCLLLRNHSS